jgi:RecA-family ATPase
MAARARGIDYVGLTTQPGRTVFISAEEGLAAIRRRLACLRFESPDANWADLAKDMVFMCVPGLPIKPSNVDGRRYEVDDQVVRHLADAILARAPGSDLVILETLSRMTVDESNEGYRAHVDATDRLAALVHAPVMTLAHTSQSAAQSGDDSEMGMRGGTAAPSNGRFSLSLSRFDRNQAAKEMFAGEKLPKVIESQLLILNAAKVNSAPDMPRVAMLKRGWKTAAGEDMGMTLARFDKVVCGDAIARARDEEDAAEALRNADDGKRLRAEVLRLIDEKGDTAQRDGISVRALRAVHERLGFSENSIDAKVKVAVKGDWLRQGEKKRNGSLGLFPGPRTVDGLTAEVAEEQLLLNGSVSP